MTVKKDFTEKEHAAGTIGGIGEETTRNKGGRKPGNDRTKAEYRFAVRLNNKEGVFLQEWAWQRRTSINEVVRGIVQEAMEKHPEVFEKMDELN
jgi:hypothetical protein